jgi:hypothetical protein
MVLQLKSAKSFFLHLVAWDKKWIVPTVYTDAIQLRRVFKAGSFFMRKVLPLPPEKF